MPLNRIAVTYGYQPGADSGNSRPTSKMRLWQGES